MLFDNAELQSSKLSNQQKKKQAKENWMTDRCQEIDCKIRTGNNKAAFNTLKLLTQRQQTKKNLMENAKGKFLTEAIQKR